MIRRALDWIGSARRENDAITSDAVRITALELALRQANLKAIIWQTKAEDLQDKLTAANDKITDLSVEITELLPLAATGRKRKASLAKYEQRMGK